MGHERRAVCRVCGDLRSLEIICPAALTAASLGLFAFWLSHFSCGENLNRFMKGLSLIASI